MSGSNLHSAWARLFVSALVDAECASVDGATEFADQFVCSFGKDAALGCFEATAPIDLRRRDRVLLESPR